ncbi:MAG: hypothetical protein N2035_09850 [Chthoniobacterales bacterium]|nr:hypothetical protein [Chthoniobacterales bacterium]
MRPPLFAPNPPDLSQKLRFSKKSTIPLFLKTNTLRNSCRTRQKQYQLTIILTTLPIFPSVISTIHQLLDHNHRQAEPQHNYDRPSQYQHKFRATNHCK